MKDEIIREAKGILLEMNVNASWKGFRYLATAVYLKIQDEEVSTMKLYEKVAKKHRTTASKVERACRYVYDSRDFSKEFSSNHKITNSELINLLVEEVKKNLKISCFL